MQMRHLKACDDGKHAERSSPLHPLPHGLGYLEATRQKGPVSVRPPVDLTPRHNKSVARPQWSDGQKSDDFRILPDEVSGQLADDNA